MSTLIDIDASVDARVDAIMRSEGDWPCRKGCDECCRTLASAPLVTREEWSRIAAALARLPAATATILRARIRESADASRPVVCPMLDREAGTCLIYDARPVACRAYGFYAERDGILGCGRIESAAGEHPDVVWGNHAALEERLRALGPAAHVAEWLNSGARG